MKKLLLLLILFSSFFAQAQDAKPTGANIKSLQSPNNPAFFYNTTDSTVGMWKGAYLFNKFYSAKKIRWMLDSLSLHGGDTLQFYRLLTNHDSLSTLQEKNYSSLDGKPDLTVYRIIADTIVLKGTFSNFDALSKADKSTTITATAPITIDGTTSADLSANRTIAIIPATTLVSGSMSAADKTKLDGIVAGANTGTVTSITMGTGLIGGTITTTGTGAIDTTIVAKKTTVAAMYEPKFAKNTGFNKNFGSTAGTVLEGRAFGTAAASATTDFAPASGSANYIQNQNTSAQSANMWISGVIKSDGDISTTYNAGGSKIGFAITDSFTPTGGVSTAQYGLTRESFGSSTVALSGYGGLGFFTFGQKNMTLTGGQLNLHDAVPWSGNPKIDLSFGGASIEDRMYSGSIELVRTGSSGYYSEIGFNLDPYNTGTQNRIMTLFNTGAATFASTIQATTAKLTNLYDGYIPYHISDDSGLGNSPISTDNSTYVNISTPIYLSSSTPDIYASNGPVRLESSWIDGFAAITIGSSAETILLEGYLLPVTTNYYDIGGDGSRWRNLYLGGAVNLAGATSGQTAIVTPLVASADTVWLPNRRGTLSVVVDSLRNGVVSSSPTENKVFDALALKAPLASPVFTTGIETPAIKVTGFTLEGYSVRSHSDGSLYTTATTASEVWLGVWNANTNTPTLSDATGVTAGDFYTISVGGTRDLGSGSIVWPVNGTAKFNGSIWQMLPAPSIAGAALTKTDDTNVTLTLSGSPSTSLVNAASLTLNWAGILASSRGGTGNGFTKFTGATTTEKIYTLPDVSASILTTNTLVSVAQGGTAANTASGARANLGLAIGTNVQAYNANLTGINQALTTTSSPSFGTVTAALVGNASTATTAGTVTTAAQTAITSVGTLSGLTVTAPIAGSVTGNAATVTTNANLTGEVISIGNVATLTDSAVIGKVLTGYTSGSGTVSATDNILQAIQKLNGNVTASTHNPVTIGTANGLSLSTQALSLALGSASVTGSISSTDWNTFNNKQPAGSYLVAADISGKKNISDSTLASGYATVHRLNGKEPAFSKNTGFNKNLGSTTGTVLEGRAFGTAANSAIGDFVPIANEGKVYVGTGLKTLSSEDFSSLYGISYLAKTDAATQYSEVPFTSGGAYTAFAGKSSTGHNHSGTYEPVLGNPDTNGKVLQSLVDGTRSWVSQSGGISHATSDGAFYASKNGVWSSLTTTLSGYEVTSNKVTSISGSSTNTQYGSAKLLYDQLALKAAVAGSTSNDFSVKNVLMPSGHSMEISSGVWGIYNGSAWPIKASGTAALFPGTVTAAGLVKGSEVERGSSRELKYNIMPFIGSATEILMRTEIDLYNLKVDNSPGVGFIAEDTDPILSGKDQKSHLMGNHLGLITKAFQEQQTKIDDLEKRVSDLEKVVNSLLSIRK